MPDEEGVDVKALEEVALSRAMIELLLLDESVSGASDVNFVWMLFSVFLGLDENAKRFVLTERSS